MTDISLITNIVTADLDLVGIYPSGATPLSGTPTASAHELSNDGHVETGVWECTPGSFRWGTDGFYELMHISAGEVVITADDGTAHHLRAGDVLFVPEGWSGIWDIRATVRKSYTIVQTRTP